MICEEGGRCNELVNHQQNYFDIVKNVIRYVGYKNGGKNLGAKSWCYPLDRYPRCQRVLVSFAELAPLVRALFRGPARLLFELEPVVGRTTEI
jgi:hypothetical protein